MINTIRYALEAGAGKNGINKQVASTVIKEFANDRRYKLFYLAASCGWSFNETGIVQYRNAKYYYAQNGLNVNVEPFRF